MIVIQSGPYRSLIAHSREEYKQMLQQLDLIEKEFGLNSDEAQKEYSRIHEGRVFASRNVYRGHEIAILNLETMAVDYLTVDKDNLLSTRRKIQASTRYFVTHKIEKLDALLEKIQHLEAA